MRLQIQTSQEASQTNLPADLLPLQPLWSKCIHYLKYFNPVQARYVGHEWRQIIEIVAQAAQVASSVSQALPAPKMSVPKTNVVQPLLAAKIIRDAMLRLDPSCAVFTSTHLLLVRFCLYAKAYTCALPVLNRHICHLPGPVDRYASRNSPALCANHDSSLAFITEDSGLSAKVTSRDLIRYFLYGGMVYLALKKWSEASHFLELAMSMPTTGPVSMIMVEAYKKWVLVGLLETGKVSLQLPRNECFSYPAANTRADAPNPECDIVECVKNLPVHCQALREPGPYFRAWRFESIKHRN